MMYQRKNPSLKREKEVSLSSSDVDVVDTDTATDINTTTTTPQVDGVLRTPPLVSSSSFIQNKKRQCFLPILVTMIISYSIVSNGVVWTQQEALEPTKTNANAMMDVPLLDDNPSKTSSNQKRTNTGTTETNHMTTTTLSEAHMPQQPSTCSNHAIFQHLQVANNNSVTQSIRIFCFLMTHSGYHNTRVAAVWKTWGSKCDYLLISSNQTDPTVNAVTISQDGSYLGLWEKLNLTMHYIYNKHFHDPTKQQQQQFPFDWILKADDDTYVIMENLKSYLSTLSKNNNNTTTPPIILGRRYASPRYRNLKVKSTYFNHSSNKEFGRRFFQKINKNKPVFYNYGGAGYVMNPQYLQRFLEISTTHDVLRDSQPPEDQALGVVMAYHDIWPRVTVDAYHRDRFHMESPWTMYDPVSINDWERFNKAHKAAAVWKRGIDCCAPESITFHHLSPTQMEHVHYQLYHCSKMN